MYHKKYYNKKWFTLSILTISLNLVFYNNAKVLDNKKSNNEIKTLGKWSISPTLYNYILKILPKGKTILELGSGQGTKYLSKHYKMHSIEHNPKWINKYKSHYIYAPIKNGWYSTEVLKKELPNIKSYDLLLIDGPTGNIGRDKFYDNINLFNTDIPIIFDDVNREAEYNLINKVSKKLKRKFITIKCFGIIFPKQDSLNS